MELHFLKQLFRTLFTEAILASSFPLLLVEIRISSITFV